MLNRPYYIKQVSNHRWAVVGPTFSKLFTRFTEALWYTKEVLNVCPFVLEKEV